MLRKIDCVMIRVDDLDAAAAYYADAFGLRPLWRDDRQLGLGFPETDAEIVLHTAPDLPPDGLVHYLVDDVVSAVRALQAKGCAIIEPPFDIRIGKCAVIRDPFGVTLCILDMTKGPR
jgi:predicted enzyme related to lactoylglutathione lyase